MKCCNFFDIGSILKISDVLESPGSLLSTASLIFRIATLGPVGGTIRGASDFRDFSGFVGRSRQNAGNLNRRYLQNYRNPRCKFLRAVFVCTKLGAHRFWSRLASGFHHMVERLHLLTALPQSREGTLQKFK